jgi:hypothetical protein
MLKQFSDQDASYLYLHSSLLDRSGVAPPSHTRTCSPTDSRSLKTDGGPSIVKGCARCSTATQSDISSRPRRSRDGDLSLQGGVP